MQTPVINSWQDVALVVMGVGIAVKWIVPMFSKRSNGTAEAEWRGRVESILDSNSQVLSAVAADLRTLNAIVVEIERRTRQSEEAIRKVLGD